MYPHDENAPEVSYQKYPCSNQKQIEDLVFRRSQTLLLVEERASFYETTQCASRSGDQWHAGFLVL